jgi:NADPH:quinone reductase-like Zn-dependent oxidoreductase
VAAAGLSRAKRIHLIGSTLRSRNANDKAGLLTDMYEKLWPLFADKTLSPRLERSFPIRDVDAAFAALASNQISGKVALLIDDNLE